MKFDSHRIHDPKFFKENCMPVHSDHAGYKNAEEAAAKESSYRFSLDGIWKFHYAKNDTQTVADFETPEYDCRPWDDIRVPAHIQMEGYDVPQMSISSIRGTEERISGGIRFRRSLIRSQVM